MSDNLQLGLSIVFDTASLNEFNKLMNAVKNVQKQLDNLVKPLEKTKQPIANMNAEFEKMNLASKKVVKEVENVGKSITQTLDMGRGKIAQVTRGMDGSVNKIKLINNGFKGIGDILTHNIKKFAEWTFAAGSFFMIINGIKNAFRTMVSLESEAINIAKVLPEGVSVQPFEQSAIRLAKEYGQSVLDVEKSMQSLARQYKNVNDITNMTRASILATTATDIEFGESVKFLSSMMALWDLNTRQAIHTIDVLNEESNNFRTTATDLSSALMKTSSAARAVGLSFEEITGLATTAIQNLGLTGDAAGTMISRVFARMRGNKSAREAIRDLGIDAMSPMSDILNQLMIKWDKLSDGQKQNFAITVAGTHHWSKFLGIMENFDTVIDATSKAYFSFNSAQDEVDRVLATTAKRIEQLNAAWEEYIHRNSGVLNITKDLIGFVYTLVQGLSQLSPTATLAVVGLTALTAAFLALRSAFIASELALGAFTKSLLLNPWTAIIAGAGVLVYTLYQMGQKASESTVQLERMQEQLDQLQQTQERSANTARGIANLAKQYNLLKQEIANAKSKGEEYNSLQLKLDTVTNNLIKQMSDGNTKRATELRQYQDLNVAIQDYLQKMVDEFNLSKRLEAEKQLDIANTQEAKLTAHLENIEMIKAEYDKFIEYENKKRKVLGTTEIKPATHMNYVLGGAGFSYTQTNPNGTLKMKTPMTETYNPRFENDAYINELKNRLKILENARKNINFKPVTLDDLLKSGTGSGGRGFEDLDKNIKDKIQPILTDFDSATLTRIETIGREWQDTINKVLSPDEQLKNDRATYVLKGQKGLLSQETKINRQIRDAITKPLENIDKAGKRFQETFRDIERQRTKMQATGEYTPQAEVGLQKNITGMYEAYQKELQENYETLAKIKSQLPETSAGFRILSEIMDEINGQIEMTKYNIGEQDKVTKQYNNLTSTIDGVATVLDRFGNSTQQAAATLLRSFNKIFTISNGKLSLDWKNMSNEDKGAMAGSLISMFGKMLGMNETEQSYSSQGAQIGGSIGGGWGALIGAAVGWVAGKSASKKQRRAEYSAKKLQGYMDKMSEMNYGELNASIPDYQAQIAKIKAEEKAWNDRPLSETRFKINLDYKIEPLEDAIKATQERIKEVIKTLSEGLRSEVSNAFSAGISFIDFSKNLHQSVYESTKNALIEAFVSSATMKPLYNSLSKMIMDATADGALSAAEINSIRGASGNIASKLQPLYQTLELLGRSFDVGGSGGSEGRYTAGASSPMVFNNYITIEAGIFMGDEDQARQTALWLRDYIVAEEQRG